MCFRGDRADNVFSISHFRETKGDLPRLGTGQVLNIAKEWFKCLKSLLVLMTSFFSGGGVFLFCFVCNCKYFMTTIFL